MSDCMTFPDTVEEFMEQYKIVDTDGIYMSKGAELVPIFRMRQWFENLPSAQPEPLTDKEQRIFLSAMGREEDVCKEVDDQWRHTREPYEDSLVYVCKEIRRKVKGVLWT